MVSFWTVLPLTFVMVAGPQIIAAVFLAGSADRVYASYGISYTAQIWFWRGVAILGPFVVFFVVRRILTELRDEEGAATPHGLQSQ